MDPRHPSPSSYNNVFSNDIKMVSYITGGAGFYKEHRVIIFNFINNIVFIRCDTKAGMCTRLVLHIRNISLYTLFQQSSKLKRCTSLHCENIFIQYKEDNILGHCVPCKNINNRDKVHKRINQKDISVIIPQWGIFSLPL